MRRKVVLLIIGALVATVLGGMPTASAEPKAGPGPTVYVGELTPDQLKQVADLGLDRADLVSRGRAGDKIAVEVVLSRRAGGQAEGRRRRAGREEGRRRRRCPSGSTSSPQAATRSSAPTASPAASGTSWSTLSQAVPQADQAGHASAGPCRARTSSRSRSPRTPRRCADGSRPAVLYSSTQHAREWITPEMNRRLLRYYARQLRRATRRSSAWSTRTELWFVPVANPDGYDYTFTEGNRLWRKNLRDNDGDGEITGCDGVDPNRNFPYRWGYDNEGSSPSSGSETYRGPAPASEPETRALDGLMRRIGFEFQINYHSAAELLLYGVGWQVATPTPDDLLYETLAGDDANPAVPGYDPDISAELYTTNGETTEHAHNRYGTLAFTPEMSTCETASAVDPDDAFEPEDCESVFNFPDSEALVQAEFEKNIPFALAVARSAQDPDDPVSVVGRTAPDFAVDSFAVSYGDPQPVAVTARRDLRNLAMHYSINGGRTYTRAGPRVARRRALRRRGRRLLRRVPRRRTRRRTRATRSRSGSPATGPGKGKRTSESFTYRLAEDTRNTVLVLANEDYEGVNPERPADGDRARSTRPRYVAALKAAGYNASVWDVSAQGVPHHLGVLEHFKAVVWYLGDNRLTQDPEDVLTEIFGARVPGRRGRRAAAVPDPLGARLPQRARQAAAHRRDGGVLRPARQHHRRHLLRPGRRAGAGLRGDRRTPSRDCLLLADDFYQYYLGAYSRSTAPNADELRRRRVTWRAPTATFGGPAAVDQPARRAGHVRCRPATCCRPSSSRSSPARRPAGTRARPAEPFDPVEGDWYAGGRPRQRLLHAAGPDHRPDRGDRGADADSCRPSCPSTPSRATTTSSSRPTRWAATTGRRCRRPAG